MTTSNRSSAHALGSDPKQVALLHGAGYVGGVLIQLLTAHPGVALRAVTSRTFANQPVWRAHPRLRGQTDLAFTDPEDLNLDGVDALLVASEHGQSAHEIPALLDAGFDGKIVDLSADFRYADPALYETWFDYTHPAPELINDFVYGIPEINGPYGADQQFVANPGCYATGITCALWPLARLDIPIQASVTALTGASGSGAKPSSATHFPTRDGNVRAYKVLAHQHTPEIQQTLGDHVDLAFVPASGPWTRGIWGTAHITLPEPADDNTVAGWFEDAYGEASCVRLWGGQLPELRAVVDTPFCDVGWTLQDQHLVVGFAIDNLMKGAASQAVQNLNLLLGLPEAAGLIPETERAEAWANKGTGAAIPDHV
jgi:N-acetyl-gamma-glutamyl-phosphate reductase